MPECFTSWPRKIKTMSRKKILYLFHYGDQHGNNGIKSIADGGSNIHIHLIKKLSAKYDIDISTYKDNFLLKHYFASSKNININEIFTLSGLFKRNLLFQEMWLRCIYPSIKYLHLPLDYECFVTKTEFLPDTLTALLLKLRKPGIKWVASYFLDPPKPWDIKSPYKGKRWFRGFFYWLFQIPSSLIIRHFSDYVLVTSKPDVKKFITAKRPASKVVVVLGGVDIEESEKYLKSDQQIPIDDREYAACFVGRLHYQKGLLELIDIWKEVVKKYKKAKLAIVGFGPLEGDVRKKVQQYGLDENIDILGYRTGQGKYQIFKNSKIILHPATYDSGGMAAAEGMAWGLPSVSFDLEALRTYYPKGMLKTKCFSIEEFSKNIVKLLENKKLYHRISDEARELVVNVWDWEKRSNAIIKALYL